MDESQEVTNWIRLSRKLARSDWWLMDEFSRGQAWVDLLMLTNWKDGQVRIRGVLIDLKRGQLAASSVWLSERWKWSRGRVGRFLDELETKQQIGQQKNNVTNVLTITNYDYYQKTGQQTDSKRTANGQQTDTEEEGIRRLEGKEGRNQNSSETSYDSEPMTDLVFPTVGKSKQWTLPSAIVDALSEAYPGVDVQAECRKAVAWCLTNKSNRKTPSGMPKFLNSWMTRQQDSGGNGKPRMTEDERRRASVLTHEEIAAINERGSLE